MSDTSHPIRNILITLINDESPYKAPTINQEYPNPLVITSKGTGSKHH